MKLSQVQVTNFRSLKRLGIAFRPLSVVIGSNGSGKSNLAEAMDFIGGVYRLGLEEAVSRKGGFESIAHKHEGRIASTISAALSVELTARDILKILGFKADFSLVLSHSFSVRIARNSVQFSISQEKFEVNLRHDTSRDTHIGTINRQGGNITVDTTRSESGWWSLSGFKSFLETAFRSSERILFVNSLSTFHPVFDAFTRSLGSIRVFQINPILARSMSAPSATPQLEKHGENLASVVDYLKRDDKSRWAAILQVMRQILPRLRAITPVRNELGSLSLFFEEGDERWNISEVSDGTIQTLAMAVALMDPRYTAVMIEEPETSIHPWIIRSILDLAQGISEHRHVVFTTHSPVVMNHVVPENVWVIWRSRSGSQLRPLTELNPTMRQLWAEGKVFTFDVVDSGVVTEAIPPQEIALFENEDI